MLWVGIIIGLIVGLLISMVVSGKAYDKGKEDGKNERTEERTLQWDMVLLQEVVKQWRFRATMGRNNQRGKSYNWQIRKW